MLGRVPWYTQITSLPYFLRRVVKGTILGTPLAYRSYSSPNMALSSFSSKGATTKLNHSRRRNVETSRKLKSSNNHQPRSSNSTPEYSGCLTYLYGPFTTRGSVLPDRSSREILLATFEKVTYVETSTSTGFLSVKNQPKKRKPDRSTSRPIKRTGSGKSNLRGI